MAVIKAVSSHASIVQALNYVMKDEKTTEKLLSGLNCEPETVKDEMQITKILWGKTGGRTYKHFVQSFSPEEQITPAQAHQIAKEFAARCPQFKDFEVLIATHEDREHVHTHFILNSVSCVDGHKFRMHKSELQQMKELSDVICSERGMHITEKGKTFSGQEREETSAYKKETYQLLKQAEQGTVKSYVQEIALAVMNCQETAVNREDFIDQMRSRGYEVDWRDGHKYVTFTDLGRAERGENQCKIRNNKLEKYYNIDFSKEGMEHGFERNARAAEAAEQPKGAASGIKQTEPDRAGKRLAEGSIGAVERELRTIDEAVKSRTSEGRAEQAERRRTEQAAHQRAEAERRAFQEQQRDASDSRRRRDWGFER